MNREKLLSEMRKLWKEGSYERIEGLLSLGAWMLTKEDVLKVKSALSTVPKEDNSEYLIEQAKKLMGAKIICK